MKRMILFFVTALAVLVSTPALPQDSDCVHPGSKQCRSK